MGISLIQVTPASLIWLQSVCCTPLCEHCIMEFSVPVQLTSSSICMALSSPSEKYPPFLANAPLLQNEKATLLQARSIGGGWGLAPLPPLFSQQRFLLNFLINIRYTVKNILNNTNSLYQMRKLLPLASFSKTKSCTFMKENKITKKFVG